MAYATTIKTTAVTAIAALALSPTPTVVARKTPIHPTSAPLPEVVVAVGEGGDREDLYVGKVLVRYPLTVAIYAATTGATQDGGTTIDTWRDLISKALNKESAYTGVPVNRVDSRDETEFAQAGFDLGQNVSFLLFTIETIEDRN